MNYPDSVQYLYSLGNETKVIKLGLETMRTLLAALGNPQTAFRPVHVAGTNGKGSTCAMIEAGLRSAGIRTGLFTSPHLIHPTERIRIAGIEVSREQFTEAFGRVHVCAEELMRQGELEYHPSYFETVTAMAFLLFRSEKVDIAVVEVGLGGRLDSTNVIEPLVSVITPVDFDHEKFLGNTLESIAFEKAGILKPGIPAVFARQRTECEAVLSRQAEELRCPVTRTSSLPVENLKADATGSEFDTGGRHVRCPLAGAHQLENCLTAIATLDILGLPIDGIDRAVWPGRLEQVHEDPVLILDGAHNPAGARALKEHIERFYANRPVWLVFGAMRDKSVQEITESLFPLAQHLVLTKPDSPRAITPESLLEATQHADAEITHSVPDAVRIALRAPAGTVVFLTGSLYVVGEARALLVK